MKGLNIRMSNLLHVGLDVGSTTVKIVVMDDKLNTIYKDYQRHFSDTKNTVCNVLEGLAEKYAGRMEIVKVDVDQSQSLAMQFGVQSIPTLLLFKDGALKETQIGFAGEPQIEAMISKYL